MVAIAEYNSDRRRAVGERFGVKALYPAAESLLRDIVPDIAAVVTPTKYYKDAVIACAESGVKGVSTDKPIAACLSDADEMVETCERRKIVYAGGNLMCASQSMTQTKERIRAGNYGKLRGAAIHQFEGEISGGGCQQISILRLLSGSEVDEVVAWGGPPEALRSDSDEGLAITGKFHLTNGLECLVLGSDIPNSVDLWTDDVFIHTHNSDVELSRRFDINGARVKIDSKFDQFEWSQFKYLTGSIRSFIEAIKMSVRPRVTGHDLRQTLEVAIASKMSAQMGSVPMKLPLEDRAQVLYPVRYRWLGGDASGRVQTVDEAANQWTG